ncbi:oligomeric golgi complex component, COG2-domain-containing protein [Pholiota molesta]|nr:oligomeric golgi complex component, COG2-domain-containing protein [Pholiota molesta]
MSATLSGERDNSSRDPFRLDHLADELATRESLRNVAYHPSDELDDEQNGLLPEYTPLSHDDKYLTAEVFDVEDFLLSRAHTSLPDLRSELRQYLAKLKEELVKLINDDYEAFISLSTDLRDEGARLERLKNPLRNLKANVLESKQELQTIQNEIHDKLTKRGKLREEKALLHLLLKISESVTRLESMLLITSLNEDNKDTLEIKNANFLVYPSHSDDSNDEKFRGNRAKHLSRVSAEYTQLLYHSRKARAQNCAFVDEVQWRIDRIQSTLSSDLDQLFSQTLTSLTDSKGGNNRATDIERSKWVADLTECLRTYDVLGLWRDAEDIIRREVVRGFVKKTIYPGALAAPHSPLVPNTPFHFPGNTEPLKTAVSAHQIPYTPFTAFIPKQALRQTSAVSSDLPQPQLLDDTDDSLAKLYNQILRFVERDLGRIMDITERITVKTSEARHDEQLGDLSPQSNNGISDDNKEFQIMANVIWDEIGTSIMDEIGGIVFAAGRPNEFRKHYETTQSFIRSLELLAPTMHAVEALRRHPTYLAFERRWQLPVYFQLRWKEIVGTLEEMLSATRLEPIIPKDGSFAMPQSSAAWIAISACWSSEIYIPELSHRFWKLTLQILSRYKGWLGETFASIDAFSNSQQDKAASAANTGRSSTPAGDTSSYDTAAADDTSMRYSAAAIIDIKLMESNMMTLWRQVIAMMMPDISIEEESEFQAEAALRECITSLTTLISPLSNNIISILTRRCCDGLLPVRSIPSQFRAMSNKRVPTEPSFFVSSILRPVKQFFAIGTAEGPGSLLKNAFLKSYSTEVFNNVTQQHCRYISYLTAMKKIEEPLKRLRKNKKTPFSLFGNTTTASDEGKDEERIRSQMILDVSAFGKDGASLQVEIEINPYFQTLKEMVYATDPE